LCDLAADLGATVLVHGSPAQRRLEPGREAESRKWGAECFAAVAETAGKAGVVYCIEPLAAPHNEFIHTVEEAAAIVEAVASPALRTMVDCCAAAQAERQAIPELLKQWLPTGLVAHVHLNDPNRRGPGEGKLAFAPMAAWPRSSPSTTSPTAPPAPPAPSATCGGCCPPSPHGRVGRGDTSAVSIDSCAGLSVTGRQPTPEEAAWPSGGSASS
jgi:D-psicose/D-tagatose/L-ribulose 3-epimerase